MQSLLPGSVSKYCLQQSPIPVIVVRPSLKREKKKKKRLADPNRRSYNHILKMSERRGSRIFDHSSSTDSSISKLPDEEAAVAEALGLPPSYANSRSSLSISERSSVSHDDQDPLSPSWNSGDNSGDTVVMKSPGIGSPDNSDNESGPGDASGSSRRASTEDLPPPGELFDSNTSTPHAEGSSSPQREETDSNKSKLRVSIPVIITEDISSGDNNTNSND